MAITLLVPGPHPTPVKIHTWFYRWQTSSPPSFSQERGCSLLCVLINTSVEGQTPVSLAFCLYIEQQKSNGQEAEGKKCGHAGTQLAFSTLVQFRMTWQVMVPLRMEILLSPPISSINEITPVDPPKARLSLGLLTLSS